MSSNKSECPEGEATASLSFLEELPEICDKCARNLAIRDGYCLFCYVEDEPDLDLVFGER